MRKFHASLPLVVIVLVSSLASAQNNNNAVRQPIAVSSGYFASLNAAPKHTSTNKLSAATNAATQAQDPRIVSVPNFTRSFNFGGSSYSYTMVGGQPTAKRTTSVPTTYVPLSFYFDEFADQNGNNITIDATTITSEIKK